MKDIPDNCGYNHVFEYVYNLNNYSVPGELVNVMNDVCHHRWGWHFIPHPDMNYDLEDWYEKQSAYISFEDEIDLTNVVLTADLN